MATRKAFQEHAVPLKLQQVVVAADAAEYFPNPANLIDHCLCSFRVFNAAAHRFERPSPARHTELRKASRPIVRSSFTPNEVLTRIAA
jgi:hypothetical protein